VGDVLRIVRYSFWSGLQDYQSIYTWKTWVAGWYVRVLAQVIFFALIGKLLGSRDQEHFLLIGNAAMLATMAGIWGGVNMTRWERNTGTLPLLVASPSSPVLVFTSRGLYMTVDGLVSSLGALVVVGVLFHLDFPWPRVLLVVPLTALIAVSGYAFAVVLGGLILAKRELGNVVVMTTITSMMALCGVNIPLSAYPAAVAALARVLPLTNGLQAIRALLNGAPASTVLAHAGAEALVFLGWALVALVTFDRLVDRGRHDGSIEFAT
jgi:ABC-2 type transport system permease protein